MQREPLFSLFYLRNDGNVGIGTATPASTLEVAGTQTWSDTTADAATAYACLNTGRCFTIHAGWGPIWIEGGSDTFTIFEIESKFEVNENSYPEFIESGAKTVNHSCVELETTSSYLHSFILMMYPSISEIMFLFSCLSEIKLIVSASEVKSNIA